MTKKKRPTVTNTYHHGSVFFIVMFRDRGVDKIKYGHEGIMIIFSTATYIVI